MKNDIKQLGEIYELMYILDTLISEGFFDNLRRNINKLLIPAVGVIVAGGEAGPAAVNAYTDYKSKTTRNAAQTRNITSQNFGNIFKEDDTIMSYLQKHPKFTITPRQFMISRYGEGWNNLLQNARIQQQNNPSIKFWTNLTDTYLDTPVEVLVANSSEEFQKMTGTKASGAFSTAKVQIYINIGDREMMNSLGGIGNCMVHEFRHSLQQVATSNTRKGTVAGVAYDMPGGAYVGNPLETGVRIGNLVQSYYNDTGKLITSPQEATKALEKYGIKLNGSPADAQNIKVDGDVEQLRILFYKMQQRSPERAKKFYEILTNQMPGIVQQTYQQTNNVA